VKDRETTTHQRLALDRANAQKHVDHCRDEVWRRRTERASGRRDGSLPVDRPLDDDLDNINEGGTQEEQMRKRRYETGKRARKEMEYKSKLILSQCDGQTNQKNVT
jgi:hypothetical protein